MRMKRDLKEWESKMKRRVHRKCETRERMTRKGKLRGERERELKLKENREREGEREEVDKKKKKKNKG